MRDGLRSDACRSDLRHSHVAQQFLGDSLDEADDQGVAHHERAFPVRHAKRPVAREAVQALKFTRGEPSVASIGGLDDVFEPRRRRPAFAR